MLLRPFFQALHRPQLLRMVDLRHGRRLEEVRICILRQTLQRGHAHICVLTRAVFRGRLSLFRDRTGSQLDCISVIHLLLVWALLIALVPIALLDAVVNHVASCRLAEP